VQQAVAIHQNAHQRHAGILADYAPNKILILIVHAISIRRGDYISRPGIRIARKLKRIVFSVKSD
jgi:hypothetical protein